MNMIEFAGWKLPRAVVVAAIIGALLGILGGSSVHWLASLFYAVGGVLLFGGCAMVFSSPTETCPAAPVQCIILGLIIALATVSKNDQDGGENQSVGAQKNLPGKNLPKNTLQPKTNVPQKLPNAD